MAAPESAASFISWNTSPENLRNTLSDVRRMIRTKLQLGLVKAIAISSVIAIVFWLFGIYPQNSLLKGLVFLSIYTFWIAFDFFLRDRDASHTFRSAFDQYLALNVLDFLGYIQFHSLQNDVQRIRQVQEKVLLRFLAANADTDYGRRFGFSKIRNRDDFIQNHPLTTYADIEPYIERMKNGELNVLTADRPKIFAVTSGTSGKSNILPFLKKQQGIFFFRGICVMSHLINTHFPGTKNLLKGVKFFYSPRWRTSPAGIPVGPNSSSPTSSKSILHLYTTPAAGFEILNENDALYVHLLFSLKNRDTGLIEANFASLVYNAFAFLEKRWSDLVRDIRDGTISGSLELPEEVRTKLVAGLKPDAGRALELSSEFEKGFEGIAQRIWPKLTLVLCVDSGAFEVYANILREKYCRGVPLYSPLYAATEGLIGLNIWPTITPSKYVLVPRAMFFEFIPVYNMEEDQPRTRIMEQVELNSDYELVITNASGLCRYRFGDVVRVVGFMGMGQCPVIQFLYRKGQLLNVRGEKLSERDVYDALNQAVRSSESLLSLMDYVTCENVLLDAVIREKEPDKKCTAPHHVFFLEFDQEPDTRYLESLKQKIDKRLQEVSYVYKSFRVNQSIGLPQLFVVKQGTFGQFRKFLLDNSEASPNQLKIPRVLKKPEQVAHVYQRVVQLLE